MILLMIVKNEEANIRRALDSAYRVGIRNAIILDTGSTDNTVLCIEAHKLVARVYSIEWQGFAKARTALMAMASEWYPDEYGVMLDADDELVWVSDEKLTCDACMVNIHYDGVAYNRVGVFSLHLPWTWKGVVHEYPDADNRAVSNGCAARIRIRGGGARSRDPLKFLHDADTINKALATETEQFLRNRYCFYLAQSYRDAGHAGAAIYWYKVVIDAGNWSEEKYVACLNLHRLTGDAGYLVRAAGINPDRAEAWRALGNNVMADRCRINTNNLFVEMDAYHDDEV